MYLPISGFNTINNTCGKYEIKEIKHEMIEDSVQYYGEVYNVEEIKDEIKDEDIEDNVKTMLTTHQPGIFNVLFIVIIITITEPITTHSTKVPTGNVLPI